MGREIFWPPGKEGQDMYVFIIGSVQVQCTSYSCG